MAYRKNKSWGVVKPQSGCGVDWDDSINKGLFGYWITNEGGGSKFFDLTGRNKLALTSTITWKGGKLGKAPLFSASNSDNAKSVVLPSVFSTRPCTLNVWAKFDSFPGSDRVLISVVDASAVKE